MKRLPLTVFLMLFVVSVAGLNLSRLAGTVEVRAGGQPANSTAIFSPETGLELPLELVGIFIVFLGASVYALDLDPGMMAFAIMTGFIYLISLETPLPWFTAPVVLILYVAVKLKG